MRNGFLKYIDQEKLIDNGQRVLLGISGGADSMVMAALFAETGIPHAFAHCNFMLRAQESLNDEAFIREYAEKRNITLYVKRFNTKEYAQKQGISIQMAARKLRFDWFEKLLDENDYNLIATAHHRDDQVETFFLNLMRSTGIAGLHGILPRQNRLIHPMLFASRKDIIDYANQYQIPYREDSSNSSLKYARNIIRHKVLPVLEDIHPNFKDILTANIKRIRETEKIYKQAVDQVLESLIESHEDEMVIPIEKLKRSNAPATYLFEYLAQFQFKFSTVEDIVSSLDGIPGKTFHSATHSVIRDRDYLFIRKNDELSTKMSRIIDKKDIPIYFDSPIRLKFDWLKKNDAFSINTDRTVAQIDADELDWPLSLEHWKTGDHFFPLGMTQAKKISDFLIDEKVPVHRKQKIWLLRSGNRVVWIAGMRIDNRFKIKKGTSTILKIKLLED